MSLGIVDDKFLKRRQRNAKLFHGLFLLATILALSILFILLFRLSHAGYHVLSWDFLNSFPSRFPEKAGIKSALYGTIWLMILVTIFAIPIGVGTAIFLEEFLPENRLKRFIDTNIANLAGVPSIIYGILGLAVFVRFFAFERSLLSGALTLTIMVLPIIIIATGEALKAVPDSIRQAAFALGATKWQTVAAHVLPEASPGILTGIILAMSRAIGETAPLIMIGALTFIAFVPESLFDPFTSLPIQIFNWSSRPQAAFHELAAGGIIVLLIVLLTANSIAIFIRNHQQRIKRWRSL